MTDVALDTNRRETVMQKALIVKGGWDGHRPQECADLFGNWMRGSGFTVSVSDTLDSYADPDQMTGIAVILQIWTMGSMSAEQQQGLLSAVEAGTGFAGFHGGASDSFRDNTEYQFMVGGQFVAHPGGLKDYDVGIVDPSHPIIAGISGFTMRNTEQYYMHVDPSNHVLATTTFPNGVVIPVVWARQWGKGRVFYASFGHTEQDFEIPEALTIVQRGIRWAARLPE